MIAHRRSSTQNELWQELPIGSSVTDLLLGRRPSYATNWGAAYSGDSLPLLRELPSECIDVVITSPPYALEFKKEYGNVAKSKYVDWLKPFGQEIWRILKPEGSFVLNIGGSYNPGSPTRSLYHFKVLLMLCEDIGFHLAQECFWHNPAKLPSPAEWVTVRRQRVKDAVEYVWWLSKEPFPKANNRNVLNDYSADMKRLLKRGYKPKQRPSGHVITAKFGHDHGGAIPSSLIERGNNESNSEYIRACNQAGHKAHPARFPRALPEFFIKLVTDEDAIVLDPFAGSNMTGATAENLRRRWIAVEIKREYVSSSRVRFSTLKTDGDVVT
ncbi:MAG TPA: site-specific DNA-methyltransferase [Candidatus Udaeobacter sp.]|jgi:site-specific DNA-methyltransferase (cytosine-N4-specific)